MIKILQRLNLFQVTIVAYICHSFFNIILVVRSLIDYIAILKSVKFMSDHFHNPKDASATNSKLLLCSLFITVSFMIVEVIGGVLSGSLTLLADAGHMFADAFALFLSWFSIIISQKPADNKRTFGYHRFQVIAAFINGISLLALTLWIIYEAINKIYNPTPINGHILFYIGALGLIVNSISFIILRQGNHEDMNIKSAIIHVLSDLLGSLAAVIAGIVIIFTGKVIADPLLSLFVSLLLLKATYRLIINSGHILLQGAPSGLTAETIIDEIKKYIPEIKNIHHFHIWSLYTGKNYITLHINLAKEEHDYSKILKKTKEILHDKFDIEHSTIQIEYDECIDLDC